MIRPRSCPSFELYSLWLSYDTGVSCTYTQSPFHHDGFLQTPDLPWYSTVYVMLYCGHCFFPLFLSRGRVLPRTWGGCLGHPQLNIRHTLYIPLPHVPRDPLPLPKEQDTYSTTQYPVHTYITSPVSPSHFLISFFLSLSPPSHLRHPLFHMHAPIIPFHSSPAQPAAKLSSLRHT